MSNPRATDLSSFNNDWYNPGNPLKRLLWYYANLIFFNSGWLPIGGLKVALLKIFGAKVGKGVVIKPFVNIKYPWKLEIGDHVWIGENVWIDNLDEVKIGSNACLSQGAMLLCGNHNYKKPTFDLMVKPITIEEGVWIGAHSVVTPGCICETHSMLAVKSVGIGKLDAYSIYQGNPAKFLRKREFNT